MTPKVITPPEDEPIPLEEARAHLEAASYGESDDDPVDELDDTMIMGWLAAAREHCEDFLGLSLSPRTLEIALDRFPTVRDDGRTYIELPMGPVSEVLSITIPDASGDSDDTDAALVDEAVYVLDDFSTPARLVSLAGWPSMTAGTNAIRIRYEAGYAIDSDGNSAMPKSIRAAILLVLGHLYAQREETTEKAMQSLPLGVEALLRPRRVLLGMA
jgi:uncharacterized phiE125 gp8 family phage protein